MAPLTDLLKSKPKRISFIPEAKSAFSQLKQLFMMAPILKLPEPSKQFIVEVGVSEVVLGVVLSHRHGEPGKLPGNYAHSSLGSCLRWNAITI